MSLAFHESQGWLIDHLGEQANELKSWIISPAHTFTVNDDRSVVQEAIISIY